jgi:hypothetical protein
MRDASGNFSADAIGEAFATGIVERADRRRDGEAGRDRQADRGHFGEVRALAAKQSLVAVAAVGNAAAEAVHGAGRGCEVHEVHSLARFVQVTASALDPGEVGHCVDRVAHAGEEIKAGGPLGGSGSLTVTLSKNASTGARSEASAAIAPSKSSASTAARALGSAESSAAMS